MKKKAGVHFTWESEDIRGTPKKSLRDSLLPEHEDGEAQPCRARIWA